MKGLIKVRLIDGFVTKLHLGPKIFGMDKTYACTSQSRSCSQSRSVWYWLVANALALTLSLTFNLSGISMSY